MSCPICGAVAEDLSGGDFDGLQIRCPHCGKFDVSGTVVDELLRLPYDDRLAALEKARRKAPNNEPATINSLILRQLSK
jgi:hypothetical protein